MEKMVISFVIIVIAIWGSNHCYAEDAKANIEVELKGEAILQQTDRIYVATLYLGKFEGIEENGVLGYEATLDYDEEIFESVEVKGLNGWSSNYRDLTKILIGDTSSAKEKTEITQIIFTLKENVEPTTTDITLSDLFVTNDQNDFQYDKKITIDIKEKQIQQEKENPNETNQEMKDGKTNEIKKTEKSTDISTAKRELPKAGMEILIILIILFFIGVILLSGKSYLSYLKDIKKQMKK